MTLIENYLKSALFRCAIKKRHFPSKKYLKKLDYNDSYVSTSLDKHKASSNPVGDTPGRFIELPTLVQGANECRDYRVAPIKWKHALASDGMRGKYRYLFIFLVHY